MTYARVLDRRDWPEVGDEVLYNSPLRNWIPTTVLEIDWSTGMLTLDDGTGVPVRNRSHGVHYGSWLLYGESP